MDLLGTNMSYNNLVQVMLRNKPFVIRIVRSRDERTRVSEVVSESDVMTRSMSVSMSVCELPKNLVSMSVHIWSEPDLSMSCPGGEFWPRIRAFWLR